MELNDCFSMDEMRFFCRYLLKGDVKMRKNGKSMNLIISPKDARHVSWTIERPK
jgi:hypothetical protein